MSQKTEKQVEIRNYIAVSWGFLQLPSTALFGQYRNPPGRLMIGEEIYKPGISVSELIELVMILSIKHDPILEVFVKEEPQDFVQQFIGAGLPIRALTYSEIIEAVAANLCKKKMAERLEDKRPALALTDKAKHLRAEMDLYRTGERDPNKPFRDRALQIHNYAITSLHLMVLGLWNTPEPRISWA